MTPIDRYVGSSLATPDVATREALTAFGPHSTLARQFNIEAGTRSMRRAPAVALVAALAVAVVGVIVRRRDA